jgi:serine/threonine protein kinase
MRQVALKMIPLHLAKAGEVFIARGIEVLSQIKGNYVARFLDHLQTAEHIILVYEFCEGGSLMKQIKNKAALDDELARRFIKQIAFTFLNSGQKGEKNLFIHRDIKPDNVMLHEGNVKLTDFDFAKKIIESAINKDDTNNTKNLGSIYYMSPQILTEKNYSSKTDVWSTGVTIYEALFLELPWRGDSVDELAQNIKSNHLVFKKKIEDDLKDLITKMLAYDEEKRFAWEEVYNHPALEFTEIEE